MSSHALARKLEDEVAAGDEREDLPVDLERVAAEIPTFRHGRRHGRVTAEPFDEAGKERVCVGHGDSLRRRLALLDRPGVAGVEERHQVTLLLLAG
jgi:hypothetical protein